MSSKTPTTAFDGFYIKGGYWCATDPRTGRGTGRKRRRISTGLKVGATTVKQLYAWKEAAAMEASVTLPETTVTAERIVEAVAFYARSPKPNGKRRSDGSVAFIQQKLSNFRCWAEEKYGEPPVFADLTDEMFREFCKSKSFEDRTKTPTLARYLTALNALKRYGFAMDLVPDDEPLKKPDWVVSASQPRTEFLDLDQIGSLLETWTPGHPMQGYAAACALLGCNHSEACAFGGKALSRNGELVEARIRGTKTENRDRDVPVPPFLGVLVLRYLRTKEPKVLRAQNARRDLFAACDKVGIPRVTSNALRASFCTALCLEGVSEEGAALLMGHTDTKMVQRVYNRLGRNRQARGKRAAEIIRRAFPAPLLSVVK